jgi:hypothetical protein
VPRCARSAARVCSSVAPLAVGFVGDVGDRALAPDVGSHPVGVVALVGDDDRAALEAIEQRLCAGERRDLARA